MKGVSGRRSIGDAAVQALAAGADLLCLGAEQDEEVLDHVHACVVAAVADGVIHDVRLGEAAARASRLGVRRPGTAGGDSASGAAVARAALRVEGAPVRGGRGMHVVELRPSPGIPAGAVPWGLQAPLASIDPTTTGTALHERDGVDAALARSRGSAVGRGDPGPAPPPLAGRAARSAAGRSAGRRRRRHGLALGRATGSRDLDHDLRRVAGQRRRRRRAPDPRGTVRWLTSPSAP